MWTAATHTVASYSFCCRTYNCLATEKSRADRGLGDDEYMNGKVTGD